MKLSIVILLSVFGMVSCVTASKVTKQKAAFDLECPKEKIKVTRISQTSYGAIGCGKKAQYTCPSQNLCVRD